MIHVVIPAAGSGRRFADAGYDLPKPLIDVLGKPMIQRVLDNLQTRERQRVTVVSQILLPTDAEVVLTEPTLGAVDTLLRAGIGDGPLLVANCDQLTSLDMDRFVDPRGDGCIATFRSSKPHHSYVELNSGGAVREIAEKSVISHHAVAGVYFFRNGKDFLDACRTVVDEHRLVLNEFYVSTAIALMVKRGARLTTMDCDVAVMGTPDELESFLSAAQIARAL